MAELSSKAIKKIEQLKSSYEASFPDKLAVLENSWVKLDYPATRNEGIYELKSASHKLAGSAYSYGFDDVTKAAKTLENICNELVISNSELKDISKDHLKTAYSELIMSLSSTKK